MPFPTSIPLVEISQTANDVTTTHSFGIGYGFFILAFLYAFMHFVPTIIKLVMSRYYPKRTIFDQISPDLIMSLLPLIKSLFETPSRSSKYSSYPTSPNPEDMSTMFEAEILRTQRAPKCEEDIHNNTNNETMNTENNTEESEHNNDCEHESENRDNESDNDQNTPEDGVVAIDSETENQNISDAVNQREDIDFSGDLSKHSHLYHI
jgi:hypothetical protein